MSRLTDNDIAEYINTTNSIMNAQKSEIEKLSKQASEQAQFIRKVAQLVGVDSNEKVLEKLSHREETETVSSWGQGTTNVKPLNPGMRPSERKLCEKLGVRY